MKSSKLLITSEMLSLGAILLQRFIPFLRYVSSAHAATLELLLIVEILEELLFF
jgi:hypothetical protein